MARFSAGAARISNQFRPSGADAADILVPLGPGPETRRKITEKIQSLGADDAGLRLGC